MIYRKAVFLVLLIFFTIVVKAQMDTVKKLPHKFEFDGQVSAYSSYSPDNDLNMFMGGRYLPELNYGYTFKNKSLLDFEASANLYGSVLFHPFDSSKTDGDIKPYRLWGRYTGNQYELRVGLQKIDFGTAKMLRPLQWFDEIDPRDPLKFTTGVYGVLGRYYFLNNANVWAWVLYGNENPRGFELLKNNKDLPEFGGRAQLPIPKGEIAGTYHHRNAHSNDLFGFPTYDNIPENRFALDGKWDVKVGLWFEAVYINKTKNMGMLTNQSYLTLGIDYTFGVGSGINVSLENMLSTYDEKAFAFENNNNVTAANIAYPLGFFDNISTMLYYSWESEVFSFFLNYEHQFKNLTGYVMAYYNPENQSGIGSTQIENSFTGPGIRLMLVYNY
ncbi:MAG: hypothetical protein RBR35_05820 [Salinivirgaceae bacterium]|nr:hypothetical protein [Salinivirgaceae bacterium]MDY0280062.1 hypothetical protein [Salinivirgaceae bacterium]